MFIEDPAFFDIFLQCWGCDFAHARGIPASATDQGTIIEEHTKVEHLNTVFASSKLSTVITLTNLFFFRFTFSNFGALFHTFSSI